jgi:hypothetical protein
MGRSDTAADTALDAHLDGCADCRAELEELRSTAAAVALADPERLHVRPAAPPLADQIVARVAHEAAAGRRRRAGRVLGGVAVAAAAIVAVVVTSSLASDDGDGRDGNRIEFAGGDTAVLTERAWGTEVTLEVEGFDDGEVYWLWLTDAGGDRVGAGTVRGTGGPLTAVFASAMPTDDARRIWVTDEDDAVVLDAQIP